MSPLIPIANSSNPNLPIRASHNRQTYFHQLFVGILLILKSHNPKSKAKEKVCAERYDGPERKDWYNFILNSFGERNDAEEASKVEL